MSLKYSEKLEIIKEILKRNFEDTCVQCGSEIEEIDDPTLSLDLLEKYKQQKIPHTTFKCTKCGFIYCSNWRYEYIKAIESVTKKTVPYKIRFDFSKYLTNDFQGDYEGSTDKFLEIREGNNSIALRFSKDQWFYLAGMFIEALSEEEKQGIAEMYFDGIILT